MDPFALESESIGVDRVGRRRRRSGGWLVCSLIALLLTPAVLVVWPSLSPMWLLAALVGMAASVYALAGLRRGARDRFGEPGGIVVHENAVEVVTDAEQLMLDPPLAGWREESRAGPSVALRFAGDVVVTIAVASRREAQALLQAAATSPAQRAVKLAIPRGTRNERRAAGCAALAAVLVGGGFLLAGTFVVLLLTASEGLGGFGRGLAQLAAAFVVLAVIVVLILLPARVTHLTIGNDGVLVERPVLRRTFVPFGAVVGVRSKGRDLLIKCRGRPTLRIRAATPEDARAARTRLNEGRSLWRERLGDEVRLRLLSVPGQRQAGDWKEMLRRVGRGEGAVAVGSAYRGAPLVLNDLVRVAESPGEAPSRRVAAVFSLAHSADANFHARVQVVVDACADPGLRQALAQASMRELDIDAIRELDQRHARDGGSQRE